MALDEWCRRSGLNALHLPFSTEKQPMFEGWHYRYRLWSIRRERDRLLGRMDDRIKKAELDGDEDGKENLIGEYLDYQDQYGDEMLFARSRYVRALADKYLIAEPSLSEKEMWSHWKTDPRKIYLSPKGAKAIHAQIRAEKKHLREERDAWLPWIVALAGFVTGSIGALTGLIAVLSK
jgi:hypothetical protein